MQRKTYGLAKEALIVCERLKEKGKKEKKRDKSRSKTCARSQSLRKTKAKFWNFDKLKGFIERLKGGEIETKI